MLSAFDDYPFHQIANYFDSCDTGDHRFFDRYWWVAYDRENRAQVNSGLGVYKNMNVIDGFGTVLMDGQQHNVRTSRAWRPNIGRTGSGPLDYIIKEGLKSFKLILEPNEFGVAFDLNWEATLPPFDEPIHQHWLDNVLHEDYRRYYQFGIVNGWAEAGGKRIEIEDWFGFRDRSFGVRPGVGGPPPSTPPTLQKKTRSASMIIGMAFAADDGTHGSVQLQEDAEGRIVYSGGRLVRQESGEWRSYDIADARCDVTLQTGSLKPLSVAFDFDVAGTAYALRGKMISDGFVYQGYGYFDGYWDQKGLGAWRGDNIVEGEIYNVTDQTQVKDLGGRRAFPSTLPHEYVLDITLNGVAGMADSMVAFMGPHPRYRLEDRS